MLTERPILFSAPMVRALLAGTKTQTRLVVKGHADMLGPPTLRPSPDARQRLTAFWGIHARPCPYGQPGDRLWVRESWMDISGTGVEARDPHTGQRTRYAFMADTPPGTYADQCRKDYGLKWKPSIHMPRWASRITLEVTEVRVQRVQDISTHDCWAEGIPSSPDVNPRHEYEELWDSINAKTPGAAWADNPWVWAVSFRRITGA